MGDDRQRFPDPDVAVDQDRHLPGRREPQQRRLELRIVERDHLLRKRDAGRLQGDPGAERPRRIVLVAEHQRERHDLPSGSDRGQNQGIKAQRQANCRDGHDQRRGWPMDPFTTLDLVALAWFVAAWTIYAVTMEWSRHGQGGLNWQMDLYRDVWMRRMLERDMRMVDMQIMAALQNGTAFFASTSLIAIGGALTLLRSTDEILSVVASLPFGIQATRAQWEAKVIGFALVLVYAFFKFAWSYRLFNYVAILLGGFPPSDEKDTAKAEVHVIRTTRLFESAGRHFNRGQRAFFFALG